MGHTPPQEDPRILAKQFLAKHSATITEAIHTEETLGKNVQDSQHGDALKALEQTVQTVENTGTAPVKNLEKGLRAIVRERQDWTQLEIDSISDGSTFAAEQRQAWFAMQADMMQLIKAVKQQKDKGPPQVGG